MDSPRAPLPPPSTLLCDLIDRPPSEAADEAVRRARAFLVAVSLGGFWTRAVLHGYTQSTHQTGVYLFSLATGERSFEEWRLWRSLRPGRDPDLPELVQRLADFRQRWLPRALEVVSVLADEGDRGEAIYYIGEKEERPSRTWTAKAFVQRLRGMEKDPLFSPLWSALVARGLLEELPAFDRALADVQEHIRTIPVDDAELADMFEAREDAAEKLEKWLADRKRELASALNEEETLVLGFGDLVPPPFPGRSAFVLRDIEIAAKA